MSIDARSAHGAFIQAGINAQKRIFDQCNLVDAGIACSVDCTTRGDRGRGDLPGRQQRLPSGSAVSSRLQAARLVHAAARHPCSAARSSSRRGVQTGGAAPSILATWTARRRRRRRSAAPTRRTRRPRSQPDGGRPELRQPQPESARPPRLEAVQASTGSGSASTSTPTTSSTATGRSRSATRSRPRRPATG